MFKKLFLIVFIFALPALCSAEKSSLTIYQNLKSKNQCIKNSEIQYLNGLSDMLIFINNIMILNIKRDNRNIDKKFILFIDRNPNYKNKVGSFTMLKIISGEVK